MTLIFPNMYLGTKALWWKYHLWWKKISNKWNYFGPLKQLHMFFKLYFPKNVVICYTYDKAREERHDFFFLESFNLWRPLLMITLYHQTKTPIGFCCRRRLNLRSLIQPLKILSIELTETHRDMIKWMEQSSTWS